MNPSRLPEVSPEARRRAPLLTVLVVLLGLTAAGQSHADCDGLLPDFDSDCERAARPEGHVSPMSMPYLFEDPYITTGANLVGIYHNFPEDSVFDGGHAGVLALQLRVALTERLAFIATKDGFTVLDPDLSLLNSKTGFMDVTVGLKYALIDDREKGLIVSPSFRYEIPLGSDDLLQGRGSGVAIPAVSVGWGPNDVHIIAGLGAQLAIDGERDSSSLFYNIHLDQSFRTDVIPGAKFFVPFIELNATTWVDSGDGRATIDLKGPGRLSLNAVQGALYPGVTADRRFEGADVANLGSKGMAGETLVTMAWGFRVPFENNVSAGFSYERVLSQREDIFEQRATWMLEYVF